MTQEAKRIQMLREKFGAVFDGSNTDLLAYVGKVTDGGCARLHQSIPPLSKRAKRVVIWITTTGGDANAAYRMARCLQRNYEHVTGYISSLCKSAGTLMAIGAHELVMDDSAEIGPLDIQVQKQDELWEYGSGLDSLEALDVLKARALAAFRDHVVEMRMQGIPTKIASEVAKSLTLGLLGPIAGHLDPVSLGETNRRLRIAQEYSHRLDNKADNLKSGEALGVLLSGYPSHGFVIDREEVSDLFNRVRAPTPNEKALIRDLSRSLRITRSMAGGEEPRALNLTQIINKVVAEATTEEAHDDVSSSTGNEGGDEQEASAEPVESRPGTSQDEQARSGNGASDRKQGEAESEPSR